MGERLDSLEQFGIEVILNRRRGFRAGMLRGLLSGLSRVFHGVVQGRLSLFRNRIKTDHYLGAMVLSVGNLTVGGTGKTPVVEMLARRLHAEGRRVAVLSRGYKSRNLPLPQRLLHQFTGRSVESPPRVVSDGSGLMLDSLTAGDEPYMLAKNLPGVAVVVDKDRVKAGRYAVRELKCDTLILDDGLQYLRLRRRLDVVLVDRSAPFGNEHLLPRGTLREPPRNLRRASHIFLTKCNDEPNDEIIARLREHNRTASILECRHRPVYLQNVYDLADRQELTFLEGKKVATISGIAVPESFENILDQLGANIVVRRRFTDHHRYTEDEIDEAILRADDKLAHFAVTTEKDAVRFPVFEKTLLPVYFLRIEIEVLRGSDALDECIGRICQPRGTAPPMKFA
jgi:tetraacyldisaccharide 4'-kinase